MRPPRWYGLQDGLWKEFPEGFDVSGVFTTLLVCPGGRAVFWAEHRKRLFANAGEVFPDAGINEANLDVALTAAQEVIPGTIYTRLKILIGKAEHETAPTIFFQFQEIAWEDFLVRRDITVDDFVFRRTTAHIKCTHPSYAFFAARREPHVMETLYFDTDDTLLEGSFTNVFCVQDGVLLTPKDHILPGIIRQKALDAAEKLGIPCQETTISRARLRTAQEIFVTSCIRLVVPVGVWGCWKSRGYDITTRIGRAIGAAGVSRNAL